MRALRVGLALIQGQNTAAPGIDEAEHVSRGAADGGSPARWTR
jgi:hypothetical protein